MIEIRKNDKLILWNMLFVYITVSNYHSLFKYFIKHKYYNEKKIRGSRIKHSFSDILSFHSWFFLLGNIDYQYRLFITEVYPEVSQNLWRRVLPEKKYIWNGSPAFHHSCLINSLNMPYNFFCSGIKEFPRDVFTLKQREHGAIICHIFLVRELIASNLTAYLKIPLRQLHKIATVSIR